MINIDREVRFIIGVHMKPSVDVCALAPAWRCPYLVLGETFNVAKFYYDVLLMS